MRTVRIAVGFALVLGLFAASAIAAGAMPRPARLSPCSDSDVAVSFGVVRGSQGAGQTSYALRVKNESSETCRTGGLPRLVLIGKDGAHLPTKVTIGCANCNAAVISLKPGISAWSEARFSPDVPGPGEDHPGGPCEPPAFAVRVTLPGTTGSVEGLIRPPTSVCSHGSIRLDFLATAKPST
jgi:Protein of unknown function (DUF4232)